MKIAATTLGETGGDWLSMTINLGYLRSTMVFFSLFIVALISQLLVRKHRPLLFWTVIIATSTAGTTMSDFMDRTLGLGYTKGAIILTRPFGATFGDVLTKSHDQGGFDFGRGNSSLILLAILVFAILIFYRKKETRFIQSNA